MSSLMRSWIKNFVASGATAAIAIGMSFANFGAAKAVPAFSAQTGQKCQACHIGGFGPQLTAFGREFKLHGYTLRTNPFNVPLSVMAVASYVQTEKDQSAPPARHYSVNDNGTIDQVSFFVAGGVNEHFGGFIQNTYDGVHRSWTWDNLDLRAVTTASLANHNVLLGASLNNSPSVQETWNTMAAWGFPYTSSSLAPSGGSAPLLSGGFAQKSLGLTGYAWIDQAFYVEGGAYSSPGAKGLARLGQDLRSPGNIHGLAPYGRIAYQHPVGSGTLEAGAFIFKADIYPGLDTSTGMTDRYTDAGVDLSYQRTLGNGDPITFNARYLHEKRSLNATYALGNSAHSSNSLDELRADAAYYWKNKVGGTVQLFSTTGSADTGLNSSPNGKPDTSGAVLQVDYTPWGGGDSPLGRRFNLRLGLQYTAYSKFNGVSTGASDNNTLRVFTWFAY